MNKKSFQKILEWGIYLLVFLLPWQTRLIIKEGSLNNDFWEYGTISLYGLDLLFFLLFIFKLIAPREKHFFVFKKNSVNLWLFLLGFLAISFFSIYWAPDAGLALYGFIKLLEGIILFWIISTSSYSFKKIGWAFSGAVILQSLIGSFQFIAQKTFSSKWFGVALQDPAQAGTSVIESNSNRFLRAYGSLPHPNILAGFLLLGLIILVGLYFQSKKRNEQYLILTGFILSSLALFFTFSRAVWLLIGASFFFHLGMVLIKKRNEGWHFFILKFMGIIFLIFLVFSFLYPDLIQTRFSFSPRLEKQSIEQRLNYYQQATTLIKNHWLNGVGINNYTLAVQDEIDSERSSLEYQPVHNVYLLVWSELGIFGLILFLVFLAQVLRIGSDAIFSSPLKDNQWAFVYSSALLVVIILFFFDHYFWTLSFGIMLFWLMVGLWQKSLSEKI